MEPIRQAAVWGPSSSSSEDGATTVPMPAMVPGSQPNRILHYEWGETKSWFPYGEALYISLFLCLSLLATSASAVVSATIVAVSILTLHISSSDVHVRYDFRTYMSV